MAELADYQGLLGQLLPRGCIWQPEDNPNLQAVLNALGEELARFDARAQDLLIESRPGTVAELIREWEFDYGLPDDCYVLGSTLSKRVSALVQKATTLGGQSRQFFIELANVLGWDITIDEFHQRTVGELCGDRLYGIGRNLIFQINAVPNTLDRRLCGQLIGLRFDNDPDLEPLACQELDNTLRRCGERLGVLYRTQLDLVNPQLKRLGGEIETSFKLWYAFYGVQDQRCNRLECVIRPLVHSHRRVIFNYPTP